MCKISIIIPVYNVETYLRQCLDSVFGQAFTEFEVICIDDCSTDNSLKILHEYKEADARLKILEFKENKGSSIARNKGMEMATGKYIYFLDSDDWIMPDALQKMWEKAEEYSTDVVLFNSCIYKEEDGLSSLSFNWNMGNLYETVMTGQEAFDRIIEKNVWSSAVWRQFWRKDFFIENQIKFENIQKVEDWIFSTISVLSAEKVVFLDMILHSYRLHSQSKSYGHDTEMLKGYSSNYIFMLAFWMSHTFSEKTNHSIKLHMDRLVRSIRNMHVQLEDVFTDEMFDDFMHQHLYQLITASAQTSLLERELDKEFIDWVKKFKQVYIYGAEGYAIEMYGQLKKWKVDIQGFVVTGFTRANTIYNFPVQRVTELQLDSDGDDVIFVLGVSAKNRKDIIHNLEKCGFENYISL